MKPLLVGETNPYGGDAEFALYPSPPGCTGHRLCHLIFQMDSDDYMERFDRANLCVGKWSTTTARAGAASLTVSHSTLVLLGRKVTSAFDMSDKPAFSIVRGVKTFIILPHPSGLNRMWGEPGAFDRARAVLREAGVL
jgi:hypothetical protein